MKTFSYIREEDIKIGEQYYFGQLWDGNDDGLELLESGQIGFYNPDIEEWVVLEFKQVNSNIIVDNDNIFDVVVEITDIC